MNYFSDLLTHPKNHQFLRFRPHGHAYRCSCGQPVYFRNTLCLECGRPLGYDSERGQLLTLATHDHGRTWRAVSDRSVRPKRYRRCANLDSAAACNWLLPAESDRPFCVACSLNRTIPDLQSQQNRLYWGKIESAKRRLVAQLLLMGLPAEPRSDDSAHGLAFDFLEQLPGAAPVMTGHNQGLITINVAEADDAYREAIRQQFSEGYRTLLGHLRHESGHYYWDRLVRDSSWLKPVRQLFGDDRRDYQAALEAYHREGPPADWQQHFISGYAASHPWEDWAETWAHYLHMTDAINTALDFGIDTAEVEPPAQPFTRDELYDARAADADSFLALVNYWLSLIAVTNELARSMGHRDLYPFVIAAPVVAKLQLIHLLVQDAAHSND